MKFKVGKLPSNENINGMEWNLLKEPKNIWITQLIALPIGIISSSLIFLILNYFSNTPFPKFGIKYITAFLLLTPIHEMVHAIFFPGGLKSKNTTIGFWPEAFVFYAYYGGIMRKNRILFSFLAPLIVLSILPTAVVLYTKFRSDLLILIILINAFSSCVDIFSSVLLLFQVPKKGVTINDGAKTYWTTDYAVQHIKI